MRPMANATKVPFPQRMAGGLVKLGILLVVVGGAFAPIADPAGKMVVLALGLVVALGAAALGGWVVTRVDKPELSQRATFWFGALTQYVHGTIGKPRTVLQSLDLFAPVALWVFALTQTL
jgi:hypothetical protein